MKNECDRDDKSCGSTCSETRKQVGKIMLVFGLIIIGLAWYIISEGLLEKVFKQMGS